MNHGVKFPPPVSSIKMRRKEEVMRDFWEKYKGKPPPWGEEMKTMNSGASYPFVDFLKMFAQSIPEIVVFRPLDRLLT